MKIFYFVSVTLIIMCVSCNEPPADGEALSKTHCSSCHAYPSPDLLDKSTWEKYVLPRMGALSGVLPLDSAGGNFMEPVAIEQNNPYVHRQEATMSKEEWQAIRKFYLGLAPDEISANPFSIDKSLPQFQVHFPDYFLSPPGSLMARFSGANLLISDAHKREVYDFDGNLNLQRKTSLSSGVVDWDELEEGAVVTCIGSFTPADQPSGQVFFLPKKPGTQPIVLVDSLRRPVQTSLSDLDGDGRFDLIISEFGKWAGQLCWWKNDGRGGFERHLLRNMPGAIRTEITDINEDGRPDVVALFAQGDEGIFAFINKGGGQFEERRLLQFPPSYGSSYFSFFDYNGDAHPDLIYTCGDQADFPPINKPYQGIYIYQNNGKGGFEQVFFQHLRGAYAAVPADFDGDGDLDIAAISFFPDYGRSPESGFVFFENTGDFKLKAHTFPQSTKGRWMVMDAADFDEDGDMDIVLGSMAFEVVPDRGEVAAWVKDGLPFVLLENRAK